MAPTKPRKPRSQSDKIADMHKPERKQDGNPTNNLQAMREAEERGLHKLLAEVRPLIAEVDAAAAVVKTKREAVNKRLDQGVADGYPKGMVRKMLAETAITGERKNQREEWEREVRYRTYLGLPAETQPDLEDRVPEAARDEQDWRGAGYAAGLRGDACNPKAAQVPDRFHQAWMEEWHNGQSKLAEAMGRKAQPKPDFDVIDGGKGKPADLGAETLQAIGEAEPEIVQQVVDDHNEGDDGDNEIDPETVEQVAQASDPDLQGTEPV